MQNLQPIFIRSNLTFKVADREFNFLNHGVSVFGISGLRWPHSDPTGLVGQPTRVLVDVLARERFKFSAEALLTAEVTTDAFYLGAKFYLPEADRKRLARTISEEGFYPTNYIRKYPRIPAWTNISAMPVRTIVQTDSDELVVFDVANMSPNGILLHSENAKAAEYMPGSRIRAQVEPRGEPYKPFSFDGQVCRIMLDKNPQSGNVARYLGIRMTRIDEDEKQNFLEILQSVLNKLKDVGI